MEGEHQVTTEMVEEVSLADEEEDEEDEDAFEASGEL